MKKKDFEFFNKTSNHSEEIRFWLTGNDTSWTASFDFDKSRKSQVESMTKIQKVAYILGVDVKTAKDFLSLMNHKKENWQALLILKNSKRNFFKLI